MPLTRRLPPLPKELASRLRAIVYGAHAELYVDWPERKAPFRPPPRDDEPLGSWGFLTFLTLSTDVRGDARDSNTLVATWHFYQLELWKTVTGDPLRT